MSAAATRAAGPAARRATVAHAVRSEWAKLCSLRSTFYTLAAFVLLAVGLTVPIGYGAAGDYHAASAADRAEFAPMTVAQFSLNVAWLGVMVLGVLVATGEYATGMIRTSLAAVPRRGRLLLAKAGVYAALVLVVGTLTALGSFVVSQAILAAEDVPHLGAGDPGVLRAVAGTGVWVTLLGLLSVAVGTLLRATAGGVAAMVVGVMIVPNLAGLLPEAWAAQVEKFYPTIAGARMMAVDSDPALLGPAGGFVVMAGFVAAMLAAALVAFARRDA